ncbi:MAG: DNA gyrase subunit A [Magnetococcales bacterium]|nr:DNA gyrase subunit A [Magnetococcales bacterium]
MFPFRCRGPGGSEKGGFTLALGAFTPGCGRVRHVTTADREDGLVPVNIEEEMERSYLDYAMSVIVGRALPDVRDGLKPVHRRVLFAMQELGNDWNRPYKKSARVVGDVIGKYHPHGDVAVYDTIVRMAQDFSMRYMLVDGQGNFGSVDGDAAAAMRYTEVRMTRLAHEVLADLDKETVPFGPNYDGSLTEPLVLPCRFPNLLVNGSSGIAVGMATNIPPHNLGEVIDATCALIDSPDLTVRELMRFVPGPDFPTGGSIHGIGGIFSAYENGRGSLVVRATTRTESNKDGRETIIVEELPYQVNKARLVERIAELVREKKVTGISDLRDESNRQGMRIVIEIKRDSAADVVLNQLYKHTPMQTTFGINSLALVGGRPQVLGIKAMLEAFINHRREVVTRRTLFELFKAQKRAHILEGLAVALANIDEIIELIRRSPGPGEAREALVARLWERGPVEAMLLAAASAGPLEQAGEIASPQFVEGGYRLTEIQAQAILDLRLHRLTGLEQDKIHGEFAEILGEISGLKAILASDSRLMEVIRTELQVIREAYADKRRTRIVEDVSDFSLADLITEEAMVVTVSHAGYIKRQPSADYQAQRRGGKGKSATGMREEDFLEQLFVASTHDTIFCFTDRGRVFRLKVYEIPQASRIARGKALVNLIPLEAGEKVRQIMPMAVPANEVGNWDLIFASRKGLVKKTALVHYANIRSNGLKAILLMPDDDLIGVALLPGQPGEAEVPADEEGGEELAGDEAELEVVESEEVEGGAEDEEGGVAVSDGAPGQIMLVSASGKAVRFRSGAVRRMGRGTKGVRGMKLKPDDQVIALTVLSPGCEVLTITETGYGKRTKEELFPTKGRGTQGVIAMITSARNGAVVGALTVQEGDQLMLITDQGTLLRTDVATIRLTGRSTQGVKVLNVGNNQRVVSIARIQEVDIPRDAIEADGDLVEEIGDESGPEAAPETTEEV